ncbi:transmembrane protein, putative (macronuclear) [Tetrahymena thermophila SB210]|uniref:Transmembrane protein, putative n=1 Tax=Tetrahymena thermophila (strain SB210) TaxID=312017 RepID=W7XGW7_TETTS|nr:transmembrane protein, putative [Tetrahymena thermophila SB210]EWS76293.1 transmembrane protein, putative [Tetrahymena thermophila SB210]|eukprot:XP_012651077.1 transmembrane protein, putative [Tetrahymena thermophila SB210]
MQLQLIVITFILVNILYKSTKVLCQNCPQNCFQCNNSLQCSQCNSGYRLDQNNHTCLPYCNFGQSYDVQSNSCQSICPNSYYSDSQTSLCKPLLPCPTMNQQGQSFFDVFLSMISSSSGKIIVQGMVGGNYSSKIIILDNQNYQPVGQLIGHDDGVIGMYNLRVNKINDLGNTSIQQAQFPQGQEILISVSRTQLIIWNLNYNQILFKILLPKSLIGYYKLVQITKDYVILMENTDTLNNFAVVYMSEIVNLPIYQQQTTSTLISSSYKLFSNAHIKSITGILILPNYQLISYGQDQKIVVWISINQPDNFQYQCSFNSPVNLVLQLSNSSYLIQIDNDYSLFIYNSFNCNEIETYHGNPIQQILANPSPQMSNIIYFFSCSISEVILYIYDTNQQIYSYISQVNSDNQYRFITNNYFVFISSNGNVSVNQFDDNTGIILIYQYNLFFKQLNPVNQVAVNNQNLLILSSELTILQLTHLPQDPKQLPVQMQITDKKKNIKTKMKYHTDAVNGILFDRLYDRVITYSIDGSFKIWEERVLENQGNVTDYRLVIEQFHPSCNILVDQFCYRQILDMTIVIPNLLACLYNDNTIVLWNYNPFKVTLNATLSLDLKTLSINNMYVYKNTFIAFNNAQQLKVYNFITMNFTSVINDSFYYAVLENNNGIDYAYFIRANQGRVIIMNLATKAILMTNSYSGNLGFAKYYSEIKYLFFSTVSNNILYIYPFLFSGVKRYSINKPVAISVDVVTKNFMVYQQDYNIAYFYWVGTSLYIYGTYTFSASVPQKLSAPLSNPEQHFFVQNTAFPAIQNQVISFSYQYNNQMLLTFADKISSMAIDPITKKLYLGFENGNIYSGGISTNYYAYIDSAYYFNGIYYNQNNRSIYAFNNNIHQIDTTTMTKPKIYSGAHKSTINDIIIDINNNWIVSYSNDTTNNFYRWNMNSTNVSQFKGGQTQNILRAFLDLDVDIIISYSSDMTFAVWQYSNQTLLYIINTHILEQAKYNASIASIPPDQQIPYKIVSYYHDPINKRIISINNNQNLFMHYYCDAPNANPPIKQNTYTTYTIPNMIDLYVDLDPVYGKFYVKVLINMIYSLQTYNFHTFAYEQQLSYHTDNILGMKYINTKSYSFQYTLLVIMDRMTQQFILSISTQNPLITNFIVFEKMDHIYLYSEWYKNVLSYRLAVHRLSTGVLIKQILNSQYIENGNVNMVFLDEEHYQLLIYKSLILNIFTVDVRTFSYTNYFTYKYNPPLKKAMFIKEHNLMCHIDAYYLEIYQMDFSFNTDKIELSMVQQKQPSYFYSQNSSMLYYIDTDNNAWQFGNQGQQGKFVQSLSLVRQTRFQNGFFYIITDQQIIQFGEIASNLQQLYQVNFEIKNAYFLDKFIFCEDFYFKLIKLSYNPLIQIQSFNFQFTSKVKQIVSISNLNQIIVFLINSSIYRIDVIADKLLMQYSSIANLNIINYDNINSILIHHLETGFMIFYLDFATQSDYMNSQARSLQIQNTDPVYSMLFDYQYNRIFVLNVRKVIPKIRVYTYNVTTVNNVIQLSTPQLITIIPPPTKAQHLVMKIQNSQLIVQAYFQINTYSLDKLQLQLSIRDSNLLQTLKSFEILNVQGQIFPYVTQYDSFSIFQQNPSTNTWGLINKLYQSFPNLAANTQIFNPTTNYYSTQVIGISNGVYFNYNFFIQNFNSQTQNTPSSSSLSQLKCYYELPSANTLDKIQSSLMSFQSSFKLLNLQMQQTLFQIEVTQKFYYDPQLINLNSQVVYSGSNSRALMNIITDSFSLNQLTLLQVRNYDLDISQAKLVLFNPASKIITFENVVFKNTGNQFQFQLSNLQSMILENISISSLDLKGQSLLFNISNSDTIYINNFYIQNIYLYDGSYLLAFEKVNYVYINNLILDQIIIVASQTANNDLIVFKNVKQISIQNSNFTNLTFKQLNNVQMQQNLYIIQSQSVYDFELQLINVSYLDGVSFTQVLNSYTSNFQTYYQYQGTFSLSNSTFENSSNLQTPLIQLRGNSYQVIYSTFKNISCLACNGGALQVIEAQQLLINFTQFTFCSALNGGGLSISDSYYNLTEIYNSIFINNNATLNGGAIYLDTTNLFMQNSTIQQNQAMIGGGIRYLKIEPVFIYMMKNHLNSDLLNQNRNLKVVQNSIIMNKATIHSNNYGSYVSNIKILYSSVVYLDITGNDGLPDSVKNDKLNLQTCSVNRFQSGQYFNFQFQLLDDENNPLYFDLELVKKNKYPPSIQSEIMQFNIRADTNNTNIKLFGQYITDYLNFNSSSKSFQISLMQLIANPQTQNMFYIESESILKVPNPSLQSRDIKSGPFHITFIVDFRECIIGELYRLQGSIYYCQECLDQTYSIVEPDKEKYLDQQCIRCPDQAEHCYRNQMTLKQGYWKSTNLTDSIVECSNKLSNCVGTQEQGYCLEGHIGPLCEQCDIQGKFWNQKYYTDGSFDCKECSKLLMAINLVPTIFIALGMVVYVLISIRIAWDISEMIVIGYYLRKLKFAPVSKSSFLDTTNMNMKAMMNYVQISQLVNTVKVALPSWLTFFPEYVGNPVQNMIYTLDCYLVNVNQQDIPIVFMRILWGLSIPFLYLAGMSIIYIIFVKLKFMRHNLSYIYSGLVFLFIFMQPNMIQNLLGAMSCREIDNQKYILSDISFKCYTPIHKKFIGFILMPGLLIWGFVIPFFILFKLNKNKDKLDDAKIRLIYGFLYQDYKTKNFYWEFVKSYMKIVIVCIYNFYGDPYTNKLVIALIVFILYIVVLVKFTPYQMIYFQQTDRNSMVVIIILVLMNIFLYNKPDTVQSQIFYIILLGIHNGYLAFMFFEVIKAKIQITFKKQFDKIKEKLSQYCSCLKPYLKIQKNIRLKTFLNWKKIKNLLHNIKVDKERGIIRDKIFGLSSQIVSSQSNIQSPLIKSSEKLVGQEYTKSKFNDKLFNEQNNMQESIQNIKIDNSSNNLELSKKKETIQLDKSDTSNQQSLQINNNNINQISISINNQTILFGSPYVQISKDEINESQVKFGSTSNNSNNNNLSPLLNNQSYEQMVIQSLNLNNSNLVKREGLISKSLKRVTQSTNITLSNNLTSQLILNQQLQQQNLNNQSLQLLQNQIISSIDQTRTIENYLFLQESPLMIPKNEPNNIFSEQKQNKQKEQEEQKEIDQVANSDIIDSASDSNNSQIKQKSPCNLEISAQESYFKKEFENISYEDMNHSQKQFDMIKQEQNDEIKEQSINQSKQMSDVCNEQSQQTPQIDNLYTPQYQDYYGQYQNYFYQNQQIDPLNLINQSDQIQPIETNKLNDVNIELQELNSLKEVVKSIKQQSKKQIKSANDLQSREKDHLKNMNFIEDNQIQNQIFTPKNYFGSQTEDSFEYRKQQTAQSSVLTNYKKVQSFKFDKKSNKIINPGTIIMDHQTIHTTDQGRIKSQSFGQGFENLNIGNTIIEYTEKNENQLQNDQQEQINYQDSVKSDLLNFESLPQPEHRETPKKKNESITNEFKNEEKDNEINSLSENE